MSDGYDRLLTAGAQMWLGSLAAASDIQERVFRAVLEGAHVEDTSVSEPRSWTVSVVVPEPTRVGCTTLVSEEEATIAPTDIGVFPLEVPGGTPTPVTFTIRAGLTLDGGMYQGSVTDGTGAVLHAPDSTDEKVKGFPVQIEVITPPKPKPG